MRIEIVKIADVVSELAAFTRPAATSEGEVRTSFADFLRCEHSPIRGAIYLIKMYGIPTFVSVHFVRHKHGVEHYVSTNRDDRKGAVLDAGRDTPVNHAMLINAQALINMSRKRLCHKAHKKTVAVMARIRSRMWTIDPEMHEFMKPECCYRNAMCPELTECKAGVLGMEGAYGLWKGAGIYHIYPTTNSPHR